MTVATSADRRASIWRGINIGLCLAGLVVFGGLLYSLQAAPRDFEARAQSFIVDEIDAALSPDSAMSRLAGIGGDLALPADRLAALQENFLAAQRSFIALFVETLCVADCRTQEFLKTELLKAYESIPTDLKPGFDALSGMVAAQYHAAFDALKRDIRIFLGANLIVLALALVLALVRGRAARHLAPLSILLTGATLLMTYWYIFGQNWILTIITSDYFGWSYLGFLGLVFLLLADIALNQARVISRILNALSDALGTGIAWSPC
ncbi:hypothetical protein [Dongia sp.]|uniref:hypothetical protein n=1 Tax=Dongia sp. TaxID=1977262 RepID=UPI0037504AFE